MRLAGDAAVVAGRDAELAHLARALEHARAGRPSVVFLEAEAGMGKSALLQAFAATRPAGGREVRIRCDAFEEDVAFAAAGLVLGTWVAETSEIEVGRRLLSWLGDRQAETDDAVVLVVDDGQWMDSFSARALRFAVHRLCADRVLTVVARRPPAEVDPWQGCTTTPSGRRCCACGRSRWSTSVGSPRRCVPGS
jgi:hypothetical protein